MNSAGFVRPVSASALHRSRGPVTVSLEPGGLGFLLSCSITSYFDDAPDTTSFDTGIPAALPDEEQYVILDRVLGLAYPLVMAGRPLGPLCERLAALNVANAETPFPPLYGDAMPSSDLLSPDTLAAVEAEAISSGLNVDAAVLMVERLVVAGVLAAPLSPALAPDAEARLSLRRFEGAVPVLPDPEPAELPE